MSRQSGKLLDSAVLPRQTSSVRLLDRETPSGYIAEWTEHVATEKGLAEAATQSVVIFRIGTEWLALATDLFQEVLNHGTVRTLPDRRGGILKGLINVRGELLLCIALEALLGIDNALPPVESTDGTDHRRLLIFKRREERFAFQVSEVFGVHRYHSKDLRIAPATLRQASVGVFTRGILAWRGKSVGCLDDELLVYTLNKRLA